jgi:hypothetical protein
MKQTASPETFQSPSSDEAILQKVLELSSRKSLPQFSLEKLLSRVPDDWKEGEDDVDEFLNSIRGRTPK